jgi:hypothetical protein
MYEVGYKIMHYLSGYCSTIELHSDTYKSVTALYKAMSLDWFQSEAKNACGSNQ